MTKLYDEMDYLPGPILYKPTPQDLAPVRVKPLVWEVCALPRHHENKWVAGPYTIRFVEDFFLVYGWDDKFKHTSVDLDDAQAAAQADYEARILAALEAPDAGVVAELVEALRQFEAHYPRGINPFLDDAHRAARAAIAKWDAK